MDSLSFGPVLRPMLRPRQKFRSDYLRREVAVLRRRKTNFVENESTCFRGLADRDRLEMSVGVCRRGTVMLEC